MGNHTHCARAHSVGDLLEAGKTREGRIDLAEKTGISRKLVLRWVNLADLFRIEGVGKGYSRLLESAGVDTVVDLSRRNSLNLHNKLVEVNRDQKIVDSVPSTEIISKWIVEAKGLARKITY